MQEINESLLRIADQIHLLFKKLNEKERKPSKRLKGVLERIERQLKDEASSLQ